jgi:hypothetical protein
MSFDLNLDNYNLTDILNLFKLEATFTESDLKKAKRKVMMMHPDKSKLDKEYFMFFAKAYKILYSMYNFKTRIDSKESTEYKIDKDDKKEELLKKFMKGDDFNKKFNELFEMNRLKNDEIDDGYGDWLKSNEDLDDFKTVKNRKEISKEFDKRKRNMRSLVKHVDYDGVGNDIISGANLIGARPDSYGGSGGTLQYEDLKKAHVETLIPVTEEDFEEKKKFGSVEEMKRFRKAEEVNPYSEEESKEMLRKIKDDNMRKDMERAYKLIQQDKESERINDEWMKNFKRIK